MRQFLKLYSISTSALFLLFMYICLLCFNMNSNHIDLGYNDDYVDHCDYIDYAELTEDNASSYKDTFTVLQLNTRGVLNKRDSLKALFNEIKKDNRIDVALLVETWLNKTTAKRFKLPGYKFLSSHRKNKKGGGVGVLVSQDLDCRSRPDLSISIPNFESLTVEIKTHSNSILVCSIYRPPNSKVKEFIKNYRRLLCKFSLSQQERLIIGLDHNLDLMKYDTHDPTREFLEFNLEQNLIPTITKPTRITKTSATLLDNIIVGKYFHNFTANIAISDISDHLPVVMNSYQPNLYKKKPLTMTTRVLNEEACRSIIEILQSINWPQYIESKTAEESYSCFHKEVQSTLDRISPLKQIKIRPSKIIKDPWMTSGLQRCTQKQRLLYKKH